MPKMYKVKQQKQVILESKALQHNVLCAYLSNRPTFLGGGGVGGGYVSYSHQVCI